jgi:hypothetical protein
VLRPDELAEVITGAVEGALAPVLERLARLEARPDVPGPAGATGAPGADGLGFGDLVLEQLSDRELAVKAIAGDRVRELGRVVFPVVLDCGVWTPGRAYVKGDAVSYGGSLWIAQAATTARPESLEAGRSWRLAVKRGRDGRTG